MPVGVLFALGSYALYSCSDAIVKSFSGHLTVFEIGFFSALFSLIPAMLSKPKGERWRDTYKLNHPWLLHVRAVTGVLSATMVVFAFTTIPLAEVYSIAFLAPVFVTIISVLVLKEHVPTQRWVLLMISFLGVLIVVRPGFRELHWGHLAAVGSAFFGSMTTTILRTVAPREKRVSVFGVPTSYLIIFNGLMMIPTFVMPTPQQLAFFVAMGILGGVGHLCFITSTRLSPASMVAPTQYSQILWAIVFGATFYHEFPDAIAYVGLAVVVVAGVLNVVPAEVRRRAVARFAILRGPAAAKAPAAANDQKPADTKKKAA
ncbi:Membrane protein, putative [Devosia sp. DBB001]|nr:Membrane protein, putative [Devosia sp. DBB001]